ncbi:MAG: hypothetical protein EA369_01355 [Bradymonadales bacterium]|nr:MAG: hypothetical protein EA369_01355 [Bradymonadales bacterium]
MIGFRFFIREFGLASAFIALGALLLICLWFSLSVQSSFLNEFRQDQLSLILDPTEKESFEQLMREESGVLRYSLQTAEENRDRIRSLYPELDSVIDSISIENFPVSALVIVEDGRKMMSFFETRPELIQAQMIHQAPDSLKTLISVATTIFLFLWVFTLILFLYFQLEGVAHRQSAKWSLMKMLGAKSSRIFLPLWGLQMTRLLVSSVCACVLAWWATSYLLSFSNWTWAGLGLNLSLGFILASLVLGSLCLYSLFLVQFRRVSVC